MKPWKSKQLFDTVLVLANERDVRTSVSFRNESHMNYRLQLVNVGSASFTDTLRCAMIVFKVACPILGHQNYACGEAVTATASEPHRPDAALPFLSGASGLMLVSMRQHLQLGEFGTSKINRWNWDFRTMLRKHPSSYCECLDDCTTLLSKEARKRIALNTCWADALWLAERNLHG